MLLHDSYHPPYNTNTVINNASAIIHRRRRRRRRRFNLRKTMTTTNNNNNFAVIFIRFTSSYYHSLFVIPLLLSLSSFNITIINAQELDTSMQTISSNNKNRNELSDTIDIPDITTTTADEVVSESNHFFCGLNWNTVANDCNAAQHCPSGMDDECELKGAVCFGGTACDASKGHGKLFDYLGLPYEDSRNRLFCASTWAGAGDNCSIEYWCKDGMCDNHKGMSCYGIPNNDCNIQDLIHEKLEQERLENGEEEDGDASLSMKVILNVDDPKRNNYCGTTWGDASYQCNTWCPEGFECTLPGQSCFADTNCYYDRDLTPSMSPTTYPPTLSPTITYDRAENMRFCGTGWSDAQQCSVETHCPNGDADCNPGETCYGYLPGCNIVDLTKALKPITPPTMPPDHLRPPIITPAPVTPAPTSWAIQWIDIDDNKEKMEKEEDRDEENFSEEAVSVETKLLFCGGTQTEAAGNCGRDGYDCSNGTCPNGLKCFVVVDDGILCNHNGGMGSNNNNNNYVEQEKEKEGEEEEAMIVMNTISPIFSPTAGAVSDISDTFFCGVDRDDANASCHKRCPKGSPDECPGGETCFAYTSCTSEISHRPPPARNPTQKPTSRPVQNNIGVQQNYCAPTKASLDTSCVTAITCNIGEPQCPNGTYCWGDHMCTGVKRTMMPTYFPTKMAGGIVASVLAGTDELLPTHPPTMKLNMKPIIIPTKWPATSRPTKMPTKNPITSPVTVDTNNQQGVSEEGVAPKRYCASSAAELITSCASAQSCAHGPCPKGMFCFPFTCESELKEDEPNNSGGGRKFYCATNLAELDERCGLATKCTGNGKACPNGLSCLPYDCKQSLDKCPLNYIGWHSSQKCSVYYQCSNGVAGVTRACGESLKFDKGSGNCIAGDLVDQFCYGPPPPAAEDGSFYCASSIAELDERCGLATKCSGKGDACTRGQSCLRYDCKQSLDRCPLNYVGMHSSQDCKEYYECSNGVAGVTQMCAESLKVDKGSGLCVSEHLVDQYCYMISDTKEEEERERVTCPKGYVGWYSHYGNCNEYFDCRIDGSIGPTYVCREGMKFDKVRKICLDEALVNDFCYGPALETGTSDDAGNGYTLENDKSSEAIAGNPNQIGTSSGESAADIPGATPLAQPQAVNAHQPGILNEDTDGNASESDTHFGKTHPSTAGSPSPASSIQSQTATTPEVSNSMSPLTSEYEPVSPSDGGDYSSDHTSLPKTYPPAINNTAAIPPWYLQHTVFDPSGGGKAGMQFINTSSWLVLFVTIGWINF